MQVGNDNTAGRSGFFINTVSSYAAPRRYTGGRRSAKKSRWEMLMGIIVRVRRFIRSHGQILHFVFQARPIFIEQCFLSS